MPGQGARPARQRGSKAQDRARERAGSVRAVAAPPPPHAPRMSAKTR